MELRLFGRVQDSIVDGPGLRYALFCQGCPHACPGCHNPESWTFDGGELLSTEDILAEIKSNPLISGVTFSGGEPLCQAKALLPLAQEIRQLGLNLWIYTGFRYEDILVSHPSVYARDLCQLAQVVVDGPFVQDLFSYDLAWRGSANQRIIDVTQSAKQGSIVTMSFEDGSSR